MTGARAGVHGGSPSVLTVILNYRTPALTLRAIEAALVAMQGIRGAVSVVDNASADGSAETIGRAIEARGWQGRVRLIESPENGGFGAGNNIGMRAGLPGGGRPDYYYVLNSDAFPAPDALGALVDTLEEDPGAGFAGSRIHGPEGEAHVTAFRFPSIASEFEGALRFGPVSRALSHRAVPITPLPEETRPVDWLAGASLLMRARTLEEIGLFDEGYFLYFEETDLCLRAARAGWRVLYVPASAVAHVGGASTGMKRWRRVPRYWYDSRLRYFTLNHGRVHAALATAAHVAGALGWRARRVVQRKQAVEPPYFLRNLVLHYLRSLGSPPRPGPIPTLPAPLGEASIGE